MFCSNNKPNVNKDNIIQDLSREEKLDEIEEYQEMANNPQNQKTLYNQAWSFFTLIIGVVVPFQIQKQFLEEKFRKLIRDPLVKELLPKQLVPPGQPIDLLPKTLVIGFEGVLVDLYQDNDKNMYKFKKRPQFDQFINKIKGNQELVILSGQDTMSLMMLTPKIDPRQEFLQYFQGFEVFGRNTPKSTFKQLDCLNRDLKNVICIDFEKTSIESFEENCCLIKEQKAEEHDENDTTLMYLGMFLENLAKNKIDVREHLAKWGNLNSIDNYKDYLEQRKIIQQERKSSIFGKLNKGSNQNKMITDL